MNETAWSFLAEVLKEGLTRALGYVLIKSLKGLGGLRVRRINISRATAIRMILAGLILLAFVWTLGDHIDYLTKNGWNQRSFIGHFLIDGWASFLALLLIIFGTYKAFLCPHRSRASSNSD